MYEVFDEFLATQAWRNRHSADEERFYCALRIIVTDPRFNAQDMRRYMLRAAPGDEETINHYVSLAEVVSAYVRAVY
jgi:hypothetical protein